MKLLKREAVYAEIESLSQLHKISDIKSCLKDLDSLPKEIKGVEILESLYKKINNTLLLLEIEKYLEKYPEELLINCSIKKTTNESCMTIENNTKTTHYVNFKINEIFFYRKMKELKVTKINSDQCLVFLLYHIQNKVKSMSGISNNHSLTNRLHYELSSEKDVQLVNKCLKKVTYSLNIEEICIGLSSTDFSAKSINKFFEYYELSMNLEKKEESKLKNKI